MGSVFLSFFWAAKRPEDLQPAASGENFIFAALRRFDDEVLEEAVRVDVGLQLRIGVRICSPPDIHVRGMSLLRGMVCI